MFSIFSGELRDICCISTISSVSGGISKSQTQLDPPTLYYSISWVFSLTLVIKISCIHCYTLSLNIGARKS